VAGSRHRVVAVVRGLTHLVEVNGSSHRISREDTSIIRAPGTSVVNSIIVAVGQEVVEGQRLALLEAMKMEMPVLAPFAGIVREIIGAEQRQGRHRLAAHAPRGRDGRLIRFRGSALSSPSPRRNPLRRKIPGRQ